MTKKELKRYKLLDDDLCPRHFNLDSIEHTFINCFDSTSSYTLTLEWFNGIHITKIYLAGNQLVGHIMFRENLITSNLTIPPKRRLDILLLYQKKYVYHCRILENNLDLSDFINKIYLQWKRKLWYPVTPGLVDGTEIISSNRVY